MPNLFHIHSSITSTYLKTTNTIERFTILNDLEELIKDLRQQTVENIDGLSEPVVKTSEPLFRIQQVLQEQTGSNPDYIQSLVQPNRTIEFLVNELNLDSLDMVEVIMRLEEEFEVCISDEDAERAFDVSEFIDLVTEVSN